MVFMKMTARATTKAEQAPPIQNGISRAGLPRVRNQEPAAAATSTTNRPRVFTTTSSYVTRPVWIGPAGGASYICSSWSLVIRSCTPCIPAGL